MTRKNSLRRLQPDAISTIFGENLLTSLTRQNTEIMTEAVGTESDVPEDASNKMKEISSEEDITQEEKNDVFIISSNRKGISDLLNFSVFYNALND